MSAPAGPAVWNGLDQATLDAAYDQARWAPDMQEVLDTRRAASAAALVRLGAPRRLAYGPDPIERIDLYDPAGSGRPAPLLLFVHGGAWRSGCAAEYASIAEAFVRVGVRVALPDFASVLDTGGDPRPLVGQVRRSIAWLQREAPGLGIDADAIVVCGHSSGAHLAAVALSGGAGAGAGSVGAAGPGETALEAPRAALLVSGMYDLAPVRRSSRSQYVAFDDEVEERFSPMRHLERLRMPLTVSWGTRESPEFVRQSRDFVRAIEARGQPVRAIPLARDHFRILEEIERGDGVLFREILRMLGRPVPTPGPRQDDGIA